MWGRGCEVGGGGGGVSPGGGVGGGRGVGGSRAGGGGGWRENHPVLHLGVLRL